MIDYYLYRYRVILLATILISSETISHTIFYTLSILFLVLTIFSRGKFEVPLFVLWPSFIIVILGSFVSISQFYFTMDTVKGLYYISRPIVVFSLGFALTHHLRDSKDVKSAVYYASVALSVFYAVKYYAFGGEFAMNRTELRGVVGTGYIVVAVAVGMAINDLIKNKISPIVIIVFLSGLSCILLSDSRTSLIVSFIYAFVSRVPLSKAALIAPALMVFTFIFTTPYVNYIFEYQSMVAFIYALPDSLSELVAVDRYTDFEIHTGWRGFETVRAFDFMHSLDTVYQMIGSGLHSEVPLNIVVNLGGNDMDSIPIFHNGFSLIFVRAGYLGLVLYLVQMIALIVGARVSRNPDTGHLAASRIVFASVLSMIVTTPLVAGFYGVTGNSICILAAACLGKTHYANRKTSQHINRQRRSLR